MSQETRHQEKSKNKLQGLYAITDENLISEEDFAHAIESALLGGANIIQYRDKSKDSKKRIQQAHTLCSLCEQHHAISIINDDIELALTVKAGGVHLGKNDESLNSARQQLGSDAIIGVSCYNNLELALDAEKNGANYVAFGAIFPSLTKPDAMVAGLDIISIAKQQLSIPICSIGGISKNNIQQVIQQGSDMTAVIGGIFTNSDIKDSAQTLSRYFDV